MINIMKDYGNKFQRIRQLVDKDHPIIVEIGAHDLVFKNSL